MTHARVPGERSMNGIRHSSARPLLSSGRSETPVTARKPAWT